MKAGIIGASGYGGGELIRLLTQHPEAEITSLISETFAGKHPSAAFPGLLSSRLENIRFESISNSESINNCDVVFLAQENGKAMKSAADLLGTGAKVIDLSADFRFRDTAIYPVWYGFEHASPALSAEAVYGLPELFANEIKTARLVGNPGCYPTASILALAPLASAGCIVPGSIIIDAKSGVSGAGRSKYAQAYHYPEANESVSAYGVGGKHRHVPEIEQALSVITGSDVRISFTPHLIPMSRGILATCYASVTNPDTVTAATLRELYAEFYKASPFVNVLAAGTPGSKHALGANYCHIGVEYDARTGRAIIISAIDNLVKGMAGQAVQNMNVVFGLYQRTGLDICSVWP
jgi:N-acetyl-gamma-glutamyl-phosphate reductase